jgi:chromosome segregation ATPase
MNQPLKDQLKRIGLKLQAMAKDYRRLQKEKQALDASLQQARKQLDEYRERIETLEQQLAVWKMSAGSLNEADKKELEKRLNYYIREIDRCVSFLQE